MAILLSNEIMNAVKQELKTATDSVQIITAYCKLGTIEQLNDVINKVVTDKRIMLRFRMDDILKGSTDFDVVEYCLNQGWDVYIRFDLHAKTYIIDNKRGVIGSANATKSGLSDGNNGNVEMGTLTDIEPKDKQKIEALYKDAIRVDRDLLAKMKKQIEEQKTDEKVKAAKWNEDIYGLFIPTVDALFTHELPEKDEYNVGDYIDFLEIKYTNVDEVRDAFRKSRVYKWLTNELKKNNGEMRFGAVSSALHDAIVNDPKPYRKDVKNMQIKLYSFIKTLAIEELVIAKYNYSEILLLK
ncbi:phospholipase D-like domain-containing protein [Pseudobutyrivibrio sp.]|uniref:phospholipase D-like domain-containing protein n=1 Tax=Pseudobutyrivibrio sp. TaxID=2014367 RepID=UPI003866D14B